MQILPRAVVVLAAVSIVGCERSAPVQPENQDATPAFSVSQAAVAASNGKPEIDPTYANGTTVYMIGPHLIPNARATMPNASVHAEALYLVTYPEVAVAASRRLPTIALSRPSVPPNKRLKLAARVD